MACWGLCSPAEHATAHDWLQTVVCLWLWGAWRLTPAVVQVAGLGQLFAALKEDVEALLLQAPSVSLDELAAQLHSTSTMLQEQVRLLGCASWLTAGCAMWPCGTAAVPHVNRRAGYSAAPC